MTDFGIRGRHHTSTMSGKSYEAEYQTSIKANRIVKDLVKQKLPKGITFDPVQPCSEAHALLQKDECATWHWAPLESLTL